MVEYLYLDLNTCDRCVGTDKVLEEVLKELQPTFALAGYVIKYKKIEVSTVELAEKFHFLSSPTIRVNGKDICDKVQESDCACCGEISGTSVDCRVFEYDGGLYEVPPKEMLVESILRYAFTPDNGSDTEDYVLPENLRSFFEGKQEKEKRRNMKIAFICVHNSCRSQIAEALGKYLASDVFESYSAGTETKPQINQDAVRIMKELYGIDMEKEQYSKLITDIPEPDIAISMGCNVGCPFIGRAFDDNWGLIDPTGESDEFFREIIKQIENNILELKEKLK